MDFNNYCPYVLKLAGSFSKAKTYKNNVCGICVCYIPPILPSLPLSTPNYPHPAPQQTIPSPADHSSPRPYPILPIV